MISGNNAMGSARVYKRMESLVRAGVPAFLLAAPLRAYTLTHSKMGKKEYNDRLGQVVQEQPCMLDLIEIVKFVCTQKVEIYELIIPRRRSGRVRYYDL